MVKAEIHCHIEGAADPALVMRLAQKYNIDVNDVIRDGRYVWHDFTTFLGAYDRAASVFRQPEDYRLLTYDYFSRLANHGAIYGEVFGSSDHASLMGIDYNDLVNAIAAGMEDAKLEFGIEGRIIMTCVRHLGPEAAEAVADTVAANPHPLVTGFGMGGDERSYQVADFTPAFEIADDAGLGLTSHAGEFAGPQSVIETLDHLGVARIGHGVRCIEDPKLVDRLAVEDIVLEVCPGSNIALGVFADYTRHPLRQLYEAGVSVTLNSDDPPFFHSDLSNEYEIATKHFGFDRNMLDQCTRNALNAAFVDEETRARLMNRLDNST
ncbi:MAG: adenosine deaminase [Rhizobiaceae bacterium]